MTTKKVKAAKTAKPSAIAEVKEVKVQSTEQVQTEQIAKEVEEKNKVSLIAHLKPKSSLFVAHSGKGTKTRDSIYREGIIPENKKSSARKAIRKALDLFAEAAEAHALDKASLTELKKDFDGYYKSIFKNNDYSVESILGGNTRDERKEQISTMLLTFKGLNSPVNKTKK